MCEQDVAVAKAAAFPASRDHSRTAPYRLLNQMITIKCVQLGGSLEAVRLVGLKTSLTLAACAQGCRKVVAKTPGPEVKL